MLKILPNVPKLRDYAEKHQSAMNDIEDDLDYQDKYRNLAIQLAEDKMNEVIDLKKDYKMN